MSFFEHEDEHEHDREALTASTQAFPVNRAQILVVLQNGIFGQYAAEVSERVDQGTTANDGAGADDRVATDLGSVADDGSKLS